MSLILCIISVSIIICILNKNEEAIVNINRAYSMWILWLLKLS